MIRSDIQLYSFKNTNCFKKMGLLKTLGLPNCEIGQLVKFN